MRRRRASDKPDMSLQDWAWSMIRNCERRISYYEKAMAPLVGTRESGGYASQLKKAKEELAYWQKELERIENNARIARMPR